MPQEHPRASSTDDFECLFSIMRDLCGKHFTVRTALYSWRNICLEFSKRLNPNLGFYYHTSTHDRFYEGERPSFDKAPHKERKNESERESRYRRWCTEELPYQLLVPGQFEWNFTMFLLACHLLLLLLPPYLIIHTSCFLIPFLKCVCVCVCVCKFINLCVCVCVCVCGVKIRLTYKLNQLISNFLQLKHVQK